MGSARIRQWKGMSKSITLMTSAFKLDTRNNHDFCALIGRAVGIAARYAIGKAGLTTFRRGSLTFQAFLRISDVERRAKLTPLAG